MNFIEKYQDETSGILHAFDRLLFTGHLTKFFSDKGMYYYLSQKQILLIDYKTFVAQQTRLLRQHIEQLANQSNVDIKYINDSKTSKDEIAKKALSKHPTQQGLISIISTQEVSNSFSLVKNNLKKELELVKQLRKHLHYYCYYMDAEFGWMFAKIQSWYPFKIQIYVNGREYLKRQLDQLGIAYKAYENSLIWVADLNKAQQLADKLIQKKWDRFLNVFARRLNVHLPQIEQIMNGGYNWFIHQCEYASDVLFKERNKLESLYTNLLQHATYFKGGEDIYSFFGRNLHGNSKKEVTGNTKRFIQGFRVKHYLDRNSIKMYDKHTLLRIETTINHSRAFKIYKTVERKGKKIKDWVPMGKSVSNLYRYTQVAQSANMKYLNSLTSVPPTAAIGRQIEQISQRTCVKSKNHTQRYFAALNLLSKSMCLVLEAINDGRFCIQAFSNKQLRELLIEKGVLQLDRSKPDSVKKLSGKVTRLLAKLKAHKLIYKVSRSCKYKLTKLGQQVCNIILQFKKLELQIL